MTGRGVAGAPGEDISGGQFAREITAPEDFKMSTDGAVDDFAAVGFKGGLCQLVDRLHIAGVCGLPRLSLEVSGVEMVVIVSGLIDPVAFLHIIRLHIGMVETDEKHPLVAECIGQLHIKVADR